MDNVDVKKGDEAILGSLTFLISPQRKVTHVSNGYNSTVLVMISLGMETLKTYEDSELQRRKSYAQATQGKIF